MNYEEGSGVWGVGGNREMGKWGSGEVGKWGSGEFQLKTPTSQPLKP
ncbi:MAG: hypothetical protein GPJ22_06890 [Microcystis aeruginosa LL13-03]|nr:hypothetical protein [Microcystis aeruginosa LL13-03]NCR66435.1 hypothetical protein [Microcystis aeruginosa LL11-07]NCS19591.1 hypothetical protein [Microcystis aeruginosa G11-06]NCS34353.1 hypothetical protein [Microcystis aeruginosa G11-01]NCT62801.1 hypothetical protein [Microcystis aeruginosa G13-01]